MGRALKQSDCQLDTPFTAISGEGIGVVEALTKDILLDNEETDLLDLVGRATLRQSSGSQDKELAS